MTGAGRFCPDLGDVQPPTLETLPEAAATCNVIVEVPPCKLAQGIEYPCTSHGIDPGVGGKAQQTGNKLVNLLMAASVKVACH